MAETPDQSLRANANITYELSRVYSSYLPREDYEVKTFLNDAAFAVGCSDAEFARKLDVSRATFSGWKARQSIPDKYLDWFGSKEFIEEIVKGGRRTKLPFRHAGVATVLALLRRYDFRFGDLEGEETIKTASHQFAGLCALAQFLQWRTAIDGTPDNWRDQVIEAMHMLVSDLWND